MNFGPDIYWGVGWFVTVCIVSAIAFAHEDVIERHMNEGGPSPSNMPWQLVLGVVVVVLVLLWPAALAVSIGWIGRQIAITLRGKK